MPHALYRPKPPLDKFVDSFWVSGDYVAQAPRERVLPSGAQSLVVPLYETPTRIYSGEHTTEAADVSGAILCGARSTPLIIGPPPGPTVGVEFKPGGAHPFFGVPANALAEQTLALDALWGASARALHERLMETPSPLGRVQLLEEHLLHRLRHSFELSPALRASLDAFEEPDLTSVAEVNRRTGLSPKRLLALFREEVGLSPKTFWRVRRFRAVLRDLEQGSLRGAALAAEHGYFDQAHFLREFRSLSGSSPREYLAKRVAGTDHVSVHG
ncbi:helix-turn-helix transcriptional regulator [Pyxidicoccus xibeiensis]|uniref:helix-turn-helix transcriptional regulator n=1 Tax=Pyxidicoccus xibeiensis TaxID=2906759 RepID=UPI0020A80ECB|nr:helix-turn-helix transcriptional regulator [Pyxidicoccus xibeiensis]MCP3137826.1 helix-turn-helix domain-containing protein [Pyxidicoccus xibeiensis]